MFTSEKSDLRESVKGDAYRLDDIQGWEIVVAYKVDRFQEEITILEVCEEQEVGTDANYEPALSRSGIIKWLHGPRNRPLVQLYSG
jgi:hypothetical protein